MDLGANKLGYAVKTLRAHFDDSAAGWNDKMRQDFEDTILIPLEREVQATIRGMSELAEVFKKMRKDCSDPEKESSWL